MPGGNKNGTDIVNAVAWTGIAVCSAKRGRWPQPRFRDSDEAAARFQQSAFSSQLPNKHYEHAFDVGGLLYQLFIVIWLNQFQIPCEKKLILQLTCRTSGKLTKPCQFSISASSASFGNIRWNRSACSSDLCRQSIGLGTGKRGCDPIEIERQLMRFLPHLQLPEVL